MYLYVFNYQTIEILEIEYDNIKPLEDVLSEYNLDIDMCQYMSSENKLNIESITKYQKFNEIVDYPIGTKLSTEIGNCIIKIDKYRTCQDCIFYDKNDIDCDMYKCDDEDRIDRKSIIFKKI